MTTKTSVDTLSAMALLHATIADAIEDRADDLYADLRTPPSVRATVAEARRIADRAEVRLTLATLAEGVVL